MKPYILGVTGVIGSGKSTVCGLLEKRGFAVIKGDEITHELYKKGNAGYDKIIDYFGPNFVNTNEVSRPKLRALVLKNHQKLWILNTLMHPLIRQEVHKRVDQLKRERREKSAQGAELKVAVEAIFFEPRDAGTFVNNLIRVDAPDSIVMERLKNSSLKLTEKELRTWLTHQRKVLRDIPSNLINAGTFAELEVALDKLLSSTLQ